MKEELTCVCAWCDYEQEHTKTLEGLWFELTHWMCLDCKTEMETNIKRIREILNRDENIF